MRLRPSIMLLCGLVLSCPLNRAPAREPTLDISAPQGHVLLEDTIDGVYFVKESLKKDYDKMQEKVTTTKKQIDAGVLSGPKAFDDLSRLEEQLDLWKVAMDQSKVLVKAGKVRHGSDTAEFTLGPERLLVITADNIKLVGWEGQTVKCVVEKSAVALDDKAADENLAAIKVSHTLGQAPQLVGISSAEDKALEVKARADFKTRKVAAKAVEDWENLLIRVRARWAPFAPFKGKDIDAVEIAGMTYDQGNRSLRMLTKSGRSTRYSSKWMRLGSLTVYVPPCKAILLRGCQSKLDVAGVKADLLIDSEGGLNRDYNGTFEIRNLQGNLTIGNDIPIQRVVNIKGNVSLMQTQQMVNHTNSSADNQVEMRVSGPGKCECRDISGDLKAWFTRIDLQMENIGGKLDVRNDFGDTTINFVKVPVAQAHRVVSQAGRVQAIFKQDLPDDSALYALTSCGAVEVDHLLANQLDSTSFGIWAKGGQPARSWNGFQPKQMRSGASDIGQDIERLERPNFALDGLDRRPGLDLISVGGKVVLRLVKTKQ